MQYVWVYVGGPFDGNQESSRYREKYPTVICRAILDSWPGLVGVYEYVESRGSAESTERVYRYRGSCPAAQANIIFAGNQILG